jgi:hypothetical protein
VLAGALVLAAALGQSAPHDAVRVHFTTPGNKVHAKLWAKQGADTQYRFVCSSPCKADIPGGMPLRATIEDHDEEPYDFVLSNDLGHEVQITARRGGRGALAGGIVMTSLGGITALVGIVLFAVSFADIRDDQAFRTAGLVCIGIGGGLTVGGITMISGRTYEPVVRQTPFENSRWASVPLPNVTQPFSLTLAF